MDLNKIREYIIENEAAPKRFEQDYFDLGICEIVLGNYSKANLWFNKSFPLMFGERPFWRASGGVNFLVEVVVLSGRTDLYPAVVEQLQIYYKSSTIIHPGGFSPMAHYSYSVMELLYPCWGNLSEWISDLLKRPKYKDLYAAGLIIQSILNQDQKSFTTSLLSLLEVHKRQTKYGGLRWAPFAYVCLSAMTLSYVAILKGLKVEVEHEYFSQGYLDYLVGNVQNLSK